MIKSSKLLVIVDSVEEAVKFYTEKLAFDIDHLEVHKEQPGTLFYAHLRKGKCSIAFRTPHVEELAEFSFIKRCANRCVELHVELKKGLDKFFQRCQKKHLKIISEPHVQPDGHRNFSLRDPFGVKLIFSELPAGKSKKPSLEFTGMRLSEQDVAAKGGKLTDVLDNMVDHLKKFGVLRRAAKKYAKLKIKQLSQ